MLRIPDGLVLERAEVCSVVYARGPPMPPPSARGICSNRMPVKICRQSGQSNFSRGRSPIRVHDLTDSLLSERDTPNAFGMHTGSEDKVIEIVFTW